MVSSINCLACGTTLKVEIPLSFNKSGKEATGIQVEERVYFRPAELVARL